MLVNPNNPDAENQLHDAKNAAFALGRELYAVKGGSDHDIDAAFNRREAVAMLGSGSPLNSLVWELVVARVAAQQCRRCARNALPPVRRCHVAPVARFRRVMLRDAYCF